MDFKNQNGLDWIDLALDTGRCGDLLNEATNFRVS
jgi:hypothetical protein